MASWTAEQIADQTGRVAIVTRRLWEIAEQMTGARFDHSQRA